MPTQEGGRAPVLKVSHCNLVRIWIKKAADLEIVGPLAAGGGIGIVWTGMKKGRVKSKKGS